MFNLYQFIHITYINLFISHISIYSYRFIYITYINLYQFSMTAGAQQALRRTMEIFSHTTRFALACNNSSKIIEPIQSRCALLRYGRLSDEQVLERLVRIAEAEGVK